MAGGAQRQPFASVVAYDRQAGAGKADASGHSAFGRLFGLLVCPAAHLPTPNLLAQPYTGVALAYIAVSAVGFGSAVNPVRLLMPTSRHRQVF